MFKRGVFVFALMTFAAVQSARADDVSNRVDQLEQQVRQLTGQIEELNYTIKQMQQANAAGKQAAAPAAPAQLAPVQQAAPVAQAQATQQPAIATQPVVKKKPVLQAPKQVGSADTSGQGVEVIGDAPVAAAPAAPAATPVTAPPPKVLGAMDNKAAEPADGGFQGQLLVAPGGDAATPDVQQVAMAETPDDLFLRAEKSLLQMQYSDAETGFKDFLSKYPDHNLAGSAEFKLGETYYAQQDFTSAAKAYLAGYKQFPKSRRAPDSLLKLGMSLGRLGQKDQACAALGSVGDEYPNAVEVKKRAQAEYKRAGCGG
jgi:tol-pal system protein YbgF